MPTSATTGPPRGAPAALHLTLDDGPCPAGTPAVLDALRGHGTATFFALGTRVRERPDLVTGALADGHEIGLHADEHVAHTELDAREIADDADRALHALAAVGVRPSLWRTPWGRTTDATPAVARARGLRVVGWDHDTHDWDGRPAGGMLGALRRALPRGGVVLCHDGIGPGARRTDVTETARLLSGVVTWAARRALPLRAIDAAAAPDRPSGR